MCAPEDIWTLGYDTFIEEVIFLGILKGWSAHYHLENDDGEGEHVHFDTLVRGPNMNFWSHVGRCTEFGGEIAVAILTLYISREAKI